MSAPTRDYSEMIYVYAPCQPLVNFYCRESSKKNSQHRFVNIRDDSWVGVFFPLCTLCLCYVRHAHVSSTYLSGEVCVVSCDMWVISYMCGTMACEVE